MKILIAGASGMVGSGVLLECLASPLVDAVVTIGRKTTGRVHPKLIEIKHADFNDLSPVESELSGIDACFWCLGISVVGLTEEKYSQITYDFTVAVASTLHRLNSDLRFVFVSAVGADSSESGSTMWARVKGRSENAVLNMGFRDSVVFRPAYIQPMKGVTSRTQLYRYLYMIAAPLYPLLKRVIPKSVTTTEAIGRAMIYFAASGEAPGPILDSEGINTMSDAFENTEPDQI
jgi:uncharacterized protein YbjT (DUF2867 family)